jgi:hypothetical protein
MADQYELAAKIMIEFHDKPEEGYTQQLSAIKQRNNE